MSKHRPTLSKATVDRLCKGMPVRSRFTERFHAGAADDLEPPSLPEVERDNPHLETILNEHFADQRNKQEQCSYYRF